MTVRRVLASTIGFAGVGLILFTLSVGGLAADGDLDTTFGGDGAVTTDFGFGHDSAYAVAVDTAGRIVAAGTASNENDADFGLVRYLPDGSLDTSFGDAGRVSTPIGTNDDAYGLAIDSAGRIVAAGAVFDGEDYLWGVARYLPDGSLDPSFADDGLATTLVGSGESGEATSVVIDAEGRIVVAGFAHNGATFEDIVAVRYLPDGSLDPGFGDDGIAFTAAMDSNYGRDVAIDTDGNIIIVGHSLKSSQTIVANLLPDGSDNPDFGGEGPGFLEGMRGFGVAIDEAGRVIVTGTAAAGMANDFAIGRLGPDGLPDHDFGVDGLVTTDLGGNDGARDVAIDPAGHLVVVGFSGDDHFTVLRYRPDGALDPSFGDDGVSITPIGTDSEAAAVVIDPAGRIVVAGHADVPPDRDFALARYEGTPPPTTTTTTTTTTLPPIDFVDDDGSIFETDIEALARAGITRGCNPPTNDRFCPDDPVTRGQMAAFLVRALGYTDNGGGDLFTDDDRSVFESDIDRLGTAGVTRGCNPPTNDRFCPDDPVTRGQMAAFLVRALGLE